MFKGYFLQFIAKEESASELIMLNNSNVLVYSREIDIFFTFYFQLHNKKTICPGVESPKLQK